MSIEAALERLHYYSIKMHKGIMLHGAWVFMVNSTADKLNKPLVTHYQTRDSTGEWQTSGPFKGINEYDMADALCILLDECGMKYQLLRHGLNTFEIMAERRIDDRDIQNMTRFLETRKTS